LPVGVSAIEALRCFQSALPPDLKSPYIMTVESQAIDDKCGTVAIVQETQHFVININCSVDPGVMSVVVKELRIGYRSVVKELLQTKSEIAAQLEQMNTKFASDMNVLKDLVAGDRKRPHTEDMRQMNPICRKKSCMKVVTARFDNGNYKKQCSSCNSY
jgi:hypothetical protein